MDFKTQKEIRCMTHSKDLSYFQHGVSSLTEILLFCFGSMADAAEASDPIKPQRDESELRFVSESLQETLQVVTTPAVSWDELEMLPGEDKYKLYSLERNQERTLHITPFKSFLIVYPFSWLQWIEKARIRGFHLLLMVQPLVL